MTTGPSTTFANWRLESCRQRLGLGSDAVAPAREHRRSVADLDIAADPVGQLRLAGDANAPQHGSGYLCEESLDIVKPRRVGWGENQFKPTWLAGKEALGLAGAMGGVIVEQQADQHSRGVIRIEQLKEGNELALAMPLTKGLSPNNRVIRPAASGRWYSSIRRGNRRVGC